MSAGIFLHDWESYFYQMEQSGQELASSLLRYKFLGYLFAALLDKVPTMYAPLQAYEQFRGRNDLETMCNFWFDLSTYADILRPLRTSKEGKSINFDVLGWCREKGFFSDKVSELFSQMHKFVKELPNEEPVQVAPNLRKGKPRASPLRKATRNVPALWELNTGVNFIARVYPKVPFSSSLDMKGTLPRKPGDIPTELCIIHARGNRIEMYVGTALLEDTPEPPRVTVDNFSDVFEEYAGAFADL